MTNSVLNEIFDNKIIAIIRGIRSDRIIDTVHALLEGGIKLIEVTFSQNDENEILDTLKCLRLIKDKFGDRVCLGAGTVISEEQVEKAVEAGAEYIISPNVDINVIQKTKELEKISIPGAFTPSEIVTAYKAGADIIKLFPAGILGIQYIKAVLAPLSHIPIIAVGGVDISNIDQFIKAGAKGVGIGGNLVNKNIVYSGEYEKIKRMAQEYINKIKG